MVHDLHVPLPFAAERASKQRPAQPVCGAPAGRASSLAGARAAARPWWQRRRPAGRSAHRRRRLSRRTAGLDQIAPRGAPASSDMFPTSRASRRRRPRPAPQQRALRAGGPDRLVAAPLAPRGNSPACRGRASWYIFIRFAVEPVARAMRGPRHAPRRSPISSAHRPTRGMPGARPARSRTGRRPDIAHSSSRAISLRLSVRSRATCAAAGEKPHRAVEQDGPECA